MEPSGPQGQWARSPGPRPGLTFASIYAPCRGRSVRLWNAFALTGRVFPCRWLPGAMPRAICLLPLWGAALLAVDRRPVLESLTISLFYNYGFYGFYGYSLQAGGHRSPEERGRRIRIVRGCLYIIHGWNIRRQSPWICSSIYDNHVEVAAERGIRLICLIRCLYRRHLSGRESSTFEACVALRLEIRSIRH